MISYFDASALVKNYVEEPGSGTVRELLEGTTPATSRLSFVEISAVMSSRNRAGSVDRAGCDRVLADLYDDVAAFYVVELTPEVVAASRTALHKYPLRPSAAIQLASCLLLHQRLKKAVRFAVYDPQLIKIAKQEGLVVVN